jgi:class 3 adenylate cyclase
MGNDFPYEFLDDAALLSEYRGWSEDVYRDFLDVRRGALTVEDFHDKYTHRRAILSLDMTGFTTSAIKIGEIESLLRIVDAQRVCIPVLRDFGADLVRCFADDVVALFEQPNSALDAAFEIHRRVDQFNGSRLASEHPTKCCIGIGFGDVYAIGPNLAQGDEMNRASKLGEDIARADETLVTERTYAALKGRPDIHFDKQHSDDQLFLFYKALPVV